MREFSEIAAHRYVAPRQLGLEVSHRHLREITRFAKRQAFGFVEPPGDLRRLTLWLDCNSNFYGACHEIAGQARGELVRPVFGLPRWTPVERLLR